MKLINTKKRITDIYNVKTDDGESFTVHRNIDDDHKTSYQYFNLFGREVRDQNIIYKLKSFLFHN